MSLDDMNAATPEQLTELYRQRFTSEEMATKQMMWSLFHDHFFAQFLSPGDTVLDLAAGSCEFINSVRSARRIAVDLNPATREFADHGVEVVTARSDNFTAVPDRSVDVVFTSNFFEHLPSKQALLDTLAECHRVLRPGGSLLVLMPNLRYLDGRYWDYFDHHLPLTHWSLQEALGLAGYDIDKVIPKFLPYTIKDAPVKIRPLQVKIYLHFPLAWKVLGKQMFVVAKRPG
jgi:SAM-dependent methyltransferase